jgi:uncharacterized protein YqhQ
VKFPDLTQCVGGCRRTFIALVSIVGMFVFGLIQKIDVTNTVASVAIALAAANGAENVMTARKKKKESEGAEDEIRG